jgi:protein-tyrosine phosphatase
LSTRVALFVILGEGEDWIEDNIKYFCKIGNVISFKNLDLYINEGSLIEVLSKLLKRYGSRHGILLYFGDRGQKVINLAQENVFLKSEIHCFAQISNVYQSGIDLNSVQNLQIHRVEPSSLQNPFILEKLQNRTMLNCLNWKWQFEQTDRLILSSKLAHKNLEKWKKTDSAGDMVKDTKFIPMKLMLDGDANHSPEEVLARYPDVGLIIDLSNDEGSYDNNKFKQLGIEYKTIKIESKTIPTSADIYYFINLVRNFQFHNASKGIIVHCHYGYNRTGLMICAFLIEILEVPVGIAIKTFCEARPPGIKHQNYIDKLYLRYSQYCESQKTTELMENNFIGTKNKNKQV